MMTPQQPQPQAAPQGIAGGNPMPLNVAAMQQQQQPQQAPQGTGGLDPKLVAAMMKRYAEQKVAEQNQRQMALSSPQPQQSVVDQLLSPQQQPQMPPAAGIQQALMQQRQPQQMPMQRAAAGGVIRSIADIPTHQSFKEGGIVGYNGAEGSKVKEAKPAKKDITHELLEKLGIEDAEITPSDVYTRKLQAAKDEFPARDSGEMGPIEKAVRFTAAPLAPAVDAATAIPKAVGWAGEAVLNNSFNNNPAQNPSPSTPTPDFLTATRAAGKGIAALRTVPTAQRTDAPVKTAEATAGSTAPGSMGAYAPRNGNFTALIDAVTGVESAGDTNATSKQGARGSMQIMPATFKQYAQPGESFENDADRRAAAIRKLQDDYKYYGGDVDKTLAAYIGGRGAVAKDGTISTTVKDANGTTPAAYVAMVKARMGGAAPARDRAEPSQFARDSAAPAPDAAPTPTPTAQAPAADPFQTKLQDYISGKLGADNEAAGRTESDRYRAEVGAPDTSAQQEYLSAIARRRGELAPRDGFFDLAAKIASAPGGQWWQSGVAGVNALQADNDGLAEKRFTLDKEKLTTAGGIADLMRKGKEGAYSAGAKGREQDIAAKERAATAGASMYGTDKQAASSKYHADKQLEAAALSAKRAEATGDKAELAAAVGMMREHAARIQSEIVAAIKDNPTGQLSKEMQYFVDSKRKVLAGVEADLQHYGTKILGDKFGARPQVAAVPPKTPVYEKPTGPTVKPGW